MVRLWVSGCAALALLFLAAAPASANVIGLDLSADFLKVALVQPGAPFEIVPNFHSKRKTDMVVTFYQDQRFYGACSWARFVCVGGASEWLTVGRLFNRE